MKSAGYNPERDGRIINAEAYPHDDEYLTIELMYFPPSQGEQKHNYARFFTDKQTARILANKLRLIFAIPDADEAWLEIARRAATNCDPAERNDDQVDKTAAELMNPSDEELIAGDQAVQDLVGHLKRMRAAGTTQRVPDGDGEWVITAEWKSNGKVN